MTDDDTTPTAAQLTRRDTLRSGGALASLLGGGVTHDLAGGPAADAMSEFRVPMYRVPESDLDSPGVVGRRVEITSGGATYSAGDQLVDTGSSWERISAGVESLNTEHADIINDGGKTLDVSNYAESGSGTADDPWVDALSNAIDALPTVSVSVDFDIGGSDSRIDGKGGTLIAPPGMYHETPNDTGNAVDIPRGSAILLKGGGRPGVFTNTGLQGEEDVQDNYYGGTTFYLQTDDTADAAGIKTVTPNDNAEDEGTQYLWFRDLEFRHDSSGMTAGNGIVAHLNGWIRGEIQNVLVEGSQEAVTADGIRHNAGTRVDHTTYRNIHVRNAQSRGLAWGGTEHVHIDGGMFNRIYSNGEGLSGDAYAIDGDANKENQIENIQIFKVDNGIKISTGSDENQAINGVQFEDVTGGDGTLGSGNHLTLPDPFVFITINDLVLDNTQLNNVNGKLSDISQVKINNGQDAAAVVPPTGMGVAAGISSVYTHTNTGGFEDLPLDATGGTELYDDFGMLDSDTNEINITNDGRYRVEMSARFNSVPDGTNIAVDLLKNGNSILKGENQSAVSGGLPASNTAVVELERDDIIKARIFQDSGGNLDVADDDNLTFVKITKI